MSTKSGQLRQDDAKPGVIARMAAAVRQAICSLHGHDALLHFEHGRISLMCVSCGYESPGWDVKSNAAPVNVAKPVSRGLRVLAHERRAA